MDGVKPCIMTLQVLAPPVAAKNIYSQKTSGSLTRLSVNGREIVREPGVEAAFERAHPHDSLALSSSATRALVASLGHEQ